MIKILTSLLILVFIQFPSYVLADEEIPAEAVVEEIPVFLATDYGDPDFTDVVFIDEYKIKHEMQLAVIEYSEPLNVKFGVVENQYAETPPVWGEAAKGVWFVLSSPEMTFDEYFTQEYADEDQRAEVEARYRRAKELYPTPDDVSASEQAKAKCCQKLIGEIRYRVEDKEYLFLAEDTTGNLLSNGIFGQYYIYDDNIWKRYNGAVEFIGLQLPGDLKFHKNWKILGAAYKRKDGSFHTLLPDEDLSIPRKASWQ